VILFRETSIHPSIPSSIHIRPKEGDVFSPFSAYCYYCRAIATLLDIPACSIKKEEMLHHPEMCISEDRPKNDDVSSPFTARC
jgi:hypothetical protein